MRSPPESLSDQKDHDSLQSGQSNTISVHSTKRDVVARHRTIFLIAASVAVIAVGIASYWGLSARPKIALTTRPSVPVSVAVAACASVLLWFHPLVWVAVARLRAEAEHAADDAVIRDGTPGMSYATHLLDFARTSSLQHVSAALGLNIGRRAALDQRIPALLAVSRRRNPAWSAARMMLAACARMAMVPLKGVQTVRLPSSPYTSPPSGSSQVASGTMHFHHGHHHGIRLHDGEHSYRSARVPLHHARDL